MNASSSAVPATSAASAASIPSSTFEQLPLSAGTQAALRAVGYITPTPIQAGTIAPALAGRDVIGAAQTGTGKTAAFMIPIVERLQRRAAAPSARARAVVLAPTRELAEQIHDLGAAPRRRPAQTRARRRRRRLRPADRAPCARRPSIIVATPGRLVDHLERGTLALSRRPHPRARRGRPHARHGLQAAARQHHAELARASGRRCCSRPPCRPTSARLRACTCTTPSASRSARRRCRRAAGDAGRLPGRMAREDAAAALGMIATNPGTCSSSRAPSTAPIASCARSATPGSAAQRLHSNRSQSAAPRGARRLPRAAATASWSRPTSPPAASTSPTSSHVINYDLPHTAEDYVHRVGRTARAGSGRARDELRRHPRSAVSCTRSSGTSDGRCPGRPGAPAGRRPPPSPRRPPIGSRVRSRPKPGGSRA